MSTPRLTSLLHRMSYICCSWNSDWVFIVIRLPANSKFEPLPLKSKRVVTSRLAWSTALLSSWWLTSETTSNEGMVDSC